jgi:hypothetical protein
VAKRLARRFAIERCRVQIPGLPDLVCFFQGVFHTITSLYEHRTLSFRTHPHRTHPENFLSLWLGKLQQPGVPSGGDEKCAFFYSHSVRSPPLKKSYNVFPFFFLAVVLLSSLLHKREDILILVIFIILLNCCTLIHFMKLIS